MPMTVNTAWLLEYLAPQCSHEELVAALPKAGLEIEGQHELKKALGAVRVGFVREKAPLAGAEGMWACRVEVERGRVVPVVCASEHEIRVGWGVPVAPVGTVLPTGKSIKEGQWHGARSEGMICLDGELGMIARGSGLHVFTDESALGAPLADLTLIPEYLLELNVLPNRPDFLGLIGIAREVAALLGLALRYPPTLPTAALPASSSVAVEIREPALCPRYSCALARGVKVGPSPAWLKARLLLAGMRPINNVVDITNYVLYEWGQPLHAFDFATLGGRKVVVRRMKPGESMELLTGKTLGAGDGGAGGVADSPAGGREGVGKPAPAPLVIADADRPVALAGIMGGAATQTTARTADVLVEAACFDPVNIRRTVREVDLGMQSRGTASSYRFERGADPNLMLEGALGRALQLLTELAGATVGEGVVDRYPSPREPRTFRLSPGRTSSYLGKAIDARTIQDCLTRLKMECSPASDAPGGDLTVRVPTWRADVNDPVVLIEDVARMIGYDQVPAVPQPAAPTLGLRSPTDQLRQALAGHLVAAGFFETRNPPLETPEMSGWLGEPGAGIVLANAQSKEMSVLRRTLLPGLVKTVDNNLRRGAESVRFFEIDRAFNPAGAGGEAGDAPGRWRVAGIAGGLLQRSDWRAGGKAVDFYTLKGVVESLLDAAKCRHYAFRPAGTGASIGGPTAAGPFVAGAAAEVFLDENRTGERSERRPAGFVGEVDPAAVRIDRLPFKLFAFELEMGALLEGFASLPAHQPLARQPAVTRDLAVLVPASAAFDEIESAIRQSAGATLESLRLVDRYQGPQVAAGGQSLAFHMAFRHPDRTLTAEEAAESIARVVKALQEGFGAQLRS